MPPIVRRHPPPRSTKKGEIRGIIAYNTTQQRTKLTPGAKLAVGILSAILTAVVVVLVALWQGRTTEVEVKTPEGVDVTVKVEQ